jgi:hypothetical protein
MPQAFQTNSGTVADASNKLLISCHSTTYRSATFVILPALSIMPWWAAPASSGWRAGTLHAFHDNKQADAGDGRQRDKPVRAHAPSHHAKY